ncbi:MAG: DUF927 domain-containing protein [Gammaproteobacteria bacterium]|nr:DUF927 domain-containing protein [Gammaproteobacteria bacterium]
MKQKIDFQAINQSAINNAVSVLNHYLPDGTSSGGEYTALNPTREDSKKGSFSVNTQSGRWSDFATEDKGGDLISLIAYLNGTKQGAAAKELSQFLGLSEVNHSSQKKTATVAQSSKHPPAEWAPCLPVPNDAPAPHEEHSRFGKPSGRWVYRDEQGAVLFYMYRFEQEGKKKSYAPLSYGNYGAGCLHWKWKGIPAPRPLYHLDQLAAKPKAKVVICEGEKAADAAQYLLPDWVAVTPPNGAQSPDKANWSPLKGRDVMIWPDNDKAGAAFADRVKALVEGVGVKSVALLVVPFAFGLDGDGLKPVAGDGFAEKWDAADAEAEGWQPMHLKQLIQKAECVRVTALSVTVKREGRKRPIKGSTFGHNFKVKESGVWFHPPSEDQQDAPKPILICDRLMVSARTRDTHGESHGRLLEFVDSDGVPHQWAMPMEMLAGDGLEVRKRLMSQGLSVAQSRKSRDLLGMYIQTQQPKDKALCVDRIGWHGGAFVLPDKVLGQKEGDRVLLQAPRREDPVFSQKGSLAEWRQQIAALCLGNSRLLFAVSLGFAASVLKPLMEESGGFNIRGASSTGKSTALRVACSVWGGANRMQRWRATGNGLEGVASMHNDTLLCLDELGQVEPREAGEIAYMLANGAGKQRSRRDGSSAAVKEWRLLFLSAGEVGLAEQMRQGGKRVMAGQAVRMVDIPADAGRGLGLFEDVERPPFWRPSFKGVIGCHPKGLRYSR